jgi:hypothetical protein
LQETAQNFEKGVLQKFLRITFYTYIPVNPYHFLKKHHNRCTLLDMLRKGTFSRIYPNAGLIFSSLSSKLCLILFQIAKSV